MNRHEQRSRTRNVRETTRRTRKNTRNMIRTGRWDDLPLSQGRNPDFTSKDDTKWN